MPVTTEDQSGGVSGVGTAKRRIEKARARDVGDPESTAGLG